MFAKMPKSGGSSGSAASPTQKPSKGGGKSETIAAYENKFRGVQSTTSVREQPVSGGSKGSSAGANDSAEEYLSPLAASASKTGADSPSMSPYQRLAKTLTAPAAPALSLARALSSQPPTPTLDRSLDAAYARFDRAHTTHSFHPPAVAAPPATSAAVPPTAGPQRRAGAEAALARSVSVGSGYPGYAGYGYAVPPRPTREVPTSASFSKPSPEAPAFLKMKRTVTQPPPGLVEPPTSDSPHFTPVAGDAARAGYKKSKTVRLAGTVESMYPESPQSKARGAHTVHGAGNFFGDFASTAFFGAGGRLDVSTNTSTPSEKGTAKLSSTRHHSGGGDGEQSSGPSKGTTPRNLLERSSVPDADQDMQTFFDAKPPNYMLCVRLPDTLRELYFQVLFYLIDFRRYEKRRLQVMRQEQFHITLAAMHIEGEAELAKVQGWMEAEDWEKRLGNALLEIGELRMEHGPVICVPMKTSSEQRRARLSELLDYVVSKLDECGVVAKRPPMHPVEEGSWQLYMTLVKHRRSLRDFTWDRSFSGCEVMRHLCHNKSLAEYDWRKRRPLRDAIKPVDLPEGCESVFEINSLELCKINSPITSAVSNQFYNTREIKDYYEIAVSCPCKLRVQVGNLEPIRMFMAEVEAETHKRLVKMTDEELTAHEEHKRQRRLEMMAAKKEEKTRQRAEAMTMGVPDQALTPIGGASSSGATTPIELMMSVGGQPPVSVTVSPKMGAGKENGGKAWAPAWGKGAAAHAGAGQVAGVAKGKGKKGKKAARAELLRNNFQNAKTMSFDQHDPARVGSGLQTAPSHLLQTAASVDPNGVHLPRQLSHAQAAAAAAAAVAQQQLMADQFAAAHAQAQAQAVYQEQMAAAHHAAAAAAQQVVANAAAVQHRGAVQHQGAVSSSTKGGHGQPGAVANGTAGAAASHYPGMLPGMVPMPGAMMPQVVPMYDPVTGQLVYGMAPAPMGMYGMAAPAAAYGLPSAYGSVMPQQEEEDDSEDDEDDASSSGGLSRAQTVAPVKRQISEVPRSRLKKTVTYQ